MNFIEEINKVGLTKEQYEECMSDISDKINGNIDIDWGDIINKYNLPITKETLRKSQSKPFGGIFVKEYFSKHDGVPSTYVEQMNSIRKEKQKLFDERAALRKISRENARGEANLEMLYDLIQQKGKEIFKPVEVKIDDNGNDIIACISDLHLGIDVDNGFGKYNSDIARDRLKQYIVEIIRIQQLYGSQNIVIMLLGDLISGNIHNSVKLENRENVVEQVQMAAELLSACVYELSKHFQRVTIVDVPGNHSRIGLKEDVLRDERLDTLVPWYMEAKLSHLDNIKFSKNKYDETIGCITVRGNEYLICHGDFDSFSESGVNKLCMFTGSRPTGIFVGHLHHSSFDDINDVKLIRSGSFVGTCDNYTIQKRLFSRPSQMVCVVDKKGIRALHPVMLD